MKNILKLALILAFCVLCIAFLPKLSGPEDFSTVTPVKFPSGDGLTDEEKTLASLTRVEGADGLYTMSFYGDYDGLVEKSNEYLLNEVLKADKKGGCTLITLTGDKNNPIYGRNFDNVDGGILVTLYRHPSKYASIAFSPIHDFEIPKDFEPQRLSQNEKNKFLHAAFLSTCGMNEKGVVTALASTVSYPIKNDEGLKTVFVTQWMREILDNAKDVDEAVNICKNLRAFDILDNTSHHILVADAEGNSVIVEYAKGEWHFMYDTKPWQVLANMPLYNVPLETRRKDWRYKKAYDMLEKMNGKGNWQDAMKIMKAVSVSGDQATTLWSFSADISERTLYVCINKEYDQVYKFNF